MHKNLNSQLVFCGSYVFLKKILAKISGVVNMKVGLFQIIT